MSRSCQTFALFLILIFGALIVCVRGEDAVSNTETLATTDAPTTTTTTTLATTTTTTLSNTTSFTPPESATNKTNPKYFALSDVPICKSKDAQLNACLMEVLRATLVQMKDGDPDLNLPPVDPFPLDKFNIQAAAGPLSGRLLLRNAKVLGFSQMQYDSVDFTVKNGTNFMTIRSHTPQLVIAGNYKADITVNNVHMRPKGTFNVTMTDLSLIMTTEGEFYDKDGHRFVRLKKFDAVPTVGLLIFNATGIFPDPQLNEIVVNVVNQYWREIYRVMLPQTQRFWGPMILRMSNEALSVVPYDNFIKDE